MQDTRRSIEPTETLITVGKITLFARSTGQGQPVIVLHGGPDFDHNYLLPELDQLKDTFRLIYYDQRGRGRSAERVRPEEVSMASEVDDIDKVRQHFQLNAPVLLGHSWGIVLALEYALQHPTRVSHLILLNPSPVSATDFAMFRKVYLEKLGDNIDRQNVILDSSEYQEGDPAAVASRYRIHFKHALKNPEHYERLMARMEAVFHKQGKEGVLKARAVEDQLMVETWDLPDYDLLPKLGNLHVPTLVITGDHDFIPIYVAKHIVQAIPNSKLVILRDCGHFTYLECFAEFRWALNKFFNEFVS